MVDPGTKVTFACGAVMKNRFMLAPMTNTQSHEDGRLSDAEFRWLTMRARGQFGLVMTCAAHVQANGKGFPGQLGIFSDDLVPGHRRLTKAIQSHGSLAVVQLHHAGLRAPAELIKNEPVSASDSEKHSARGLSTVEVRQLRDDFVRAARRAKRSGYDGVEIHGAHGYIIAQFLSAKYNRRKDEYGGDLENRSRLLLEIIEGIRRGCGPEFLLGVRLSPERFGLDLMEMKLLCDRMIKSNKIDFLDISMWDCFKLPHDEKYQDRTLLEHFTALDCGNVMLTAAGKIRNGPAVHRVLSAGLDFVTIGRSAVLHHDFPARVIEQPEFEPVQTPVSPDYLHREGLSDAFVNYMRRWPKFVKESK